MLFVIFSMNSSINFYDRNNNLGNNSLITASITNNLSNTSMINQRQPNVTSREKQKIAQQNSQIEKASRENTKTNSTHLRKENSFYTNGSGAGGIGMSSSNQNANNTTTASNKLNMDATNLISNSIYGNSSNISLISNNQSTQQFKHSSRAVLSNKQLNSQTNTANTNHTNHSKIDCLTSSGKYKKSNQPMCVSIMI